MKRLLLVGLDEPEYLDIKPHIEMPIVFHPDLPPFRLDKGNLLVERHDAGGRFTQVSHVIFHGIFEKDFDFISALALWGGPCLPSARGLLDCRLRVPCLARAISITKFAAMKRGFIAGDLPYKAEIETVAKWGNWHCGENKKKFHDVYQSKEATLFEPFIQGQAVRIVLVGPHFWQIRLEGDNWLKSIHHEKATFMEVDPELLEDTQTLAKHLHLEVIGVDYMVAINGEKHLLEVNHIPNMTRFPEIRSKFLSFASSFFSQA